MDVSAPLLNSVDYASMRSLTGSLINRPSMPMHSRSDLGRQGTGSGLGGHRSLSGSTEWEKLTCPLEAGERVPFHWPNMHKSRRIRIRLRDSRWNWSGAFEPEELGNYTLKMRHQVKTFPYLVKVNVKMEGSTKYITFMPENEEVCICECECVRE
jgi:Vacuolar-sorting associated protein 13, adaptor binding domain